MAIRKKRSRKMLTISKCVDVDVEVEVDITDFEDEELIDELESRGFKVAEENRLVEVEETEAQIALDEFYSGRLTEAMIHLSRALPKDFSRIVDKAIK